MSSVSQAQVIQVEAEQAICQKSSTWQARLSRSIWDHDDKSDEERRFVRRLDSALLTCGCISYFCKYLNQANISNAYASGMKEAVGFTGNQYNILLTMFTVGYLIGQVPGPILMMKVSPSIWLPAMEITWSVLAMCCAAAKNVKTLYALRFLIGLAEATAYPGMVWVLGTWYTPAELGKRTVIFICSSSVGTMFSGYLQAAVLGLDGRGGLQGYQWLFILDGIISIAIGVTGFLMLPDIPSRPNPRARWWLREKDIAMARMRMERSNRSSSTKITIRSFIGALNSWVLWCFFVPYVAYGISLNGYAYMNLWLKADGYSKSAINLIPTGGYGVQIVASVLLAWLSDFTRNRWACIVAGAAVALTGNIILACWPSSQQLKLAAFYLNFTCVGGGAIMLSWVNEVMGQEAERRAVVIGILSTITVFTSWAPNLIFPASKAPKYPYGYKVNGALIALEIVTIFLASLVVKYKTGKSQGESEVIHHDAPLADEAASETKDVVGQA